MKLSTTLRNIRDQLRGHEIADGQIIIRGAALSSLVEALDLAADGAAALEHELEEARGTRLAAGRVVRLPRRLRPVSDQRFSPWRPAQGRFPGLRISEDDGGDAA